MSPHLVSNCWPIKLCWYTRWKQVPSMHRSNNNWIFDVCGYARPSWHLTVSQVSAAMARPLFFSFQNEFLRMHKFPKAVLKNQHTGSYICFMNVHIILWMLFCNCFSSVLDLLFINVCQTTLKLKRKEKKWNWNQRQESILFTKGCCIFFLILSTVHVHVWLSHIGTIWVNCPSSKFMLKVKFQTNCLDYEAVFL